MISEQEREIMRQSYLFLAAHCAPPSNDDDNAAKWWEETVREMTEMSRAWQVYSPEHMLMDQQLLSLFDYIEEKARLATAEARTEMT